MPTSCLPRRNRRLLLRNALAAAALLVAAHVQPVRAEVDAATANRIAALRSDAKALEHGEGITRDAARAAALYCEAARLGDAEAQFSLGWMYANGRGIARDNRMASLFFGMAAEQGHEYAKKMLAFVGPSGSTIELPECMRDPPPLPFWEVVAPAPIEDDFVASTPDQKRAAALVRKLAPEYSVSPTLALAIIRAESNFDPNARSPKNAQGLMQLIPETSARFNVKKPYDPVQNVRGGLAYLRWLLAYFKGNVALVAAAYNAGEGAVEKYLGIPPYAETRAYVQRIKRYFRRDNHPFDSTVTDPSPELPRIGVVTVH
ncbi:MAG TPA: transglycosylase SLT domain-containing protein [Casimicrobiaceae bacterium]|nr:transglycosylase SLT domain-containing protein [Casimicrobiaceae bacterium]